MNDRLRFIRRGSVGFLTGDDGQVRPFACRDDGHMMVKKCLSNAMLMDECDMIIDNGMRASRRSEIVSELFRDKQLRKAFFKIADIGVSKGFMSKNMGTTSLFQMWLDRTRSVSPGQVLPYTKFGELQQEMLDCKWLPANDFPMSEDGGAYY